jgi:hypothetical protein
VDFDVGNGFRYGVHSIRLLVAVFGSLCQATLAMLPVLMHAAVWWRGDLARRPVIASGRGWFLVDVAVAVLCSAVLVTGTISSVQALVEAGHGGNSSARMQAAAAH